MKKNSMKKNFIYNLIYEIFAIILPLLTSPYITRVLGVERLGQYSYSYSVAYYFVLVSMLGIKNYGNRQIAQMREDPKKLGDVFSNIFALHAIISIICTLLYIGYIFSIKEDRLYAVFQGIYVISAIFDISWFYFGVEKFKFVVARNSFVRILNVIFIFAFVRNESDLWKYCLIMAMGTLVSQITLWIPLKSQVKMVTPKFSKMIVHLKPLFFLFIPAVAISVYKHMDKIMIGILSNKTELGFYDNAEKVINIPITIIAAFGTVMLPRMSNLAVGDNKKESRRYLEISMQFIMCIAFALTFGLAGVARQFAPLFWGAKLQSADVLIMGLATTIPFISFANVIRTQYLIPNSKDTEYILSVIFGAVVNFTSNWILIPKMGAMGAVIGTIVAEITVCALQTYMVRRELSVGSYIKYSMPYALYGGVMFAIVYYWGLQRRTNLNTLLMQIVMGIVFYTFASVLYFRMTKNSTFLEIVKNWKKKHKK
jgi:Membrane protein involved in the export of O-antigen and teichoic acid